MGCVAIYSKELTGNLECLKTNAAKNLLLKSRDFLLFLSLPF